MKIVIIDTELTAKKIKEKCQEKGIKVKDIQKAMQLNSTQSIYKWFSGKTPTLPTIDHLVQLAILLDCRIEDLIETKEINVEYKDDWRPH